MQKNDSLKIEIDYDRSNDKLSICVTNVSAKEIIVPFYRKTNLSYNPAPGLVLFVYEEQENDYVEMSGNIDYDKSLLGDTLPDKKFQSNEKDCENTFSPDFFFNFSLGKNYKFVVRYYAEYTREHHDKYIESNIVTIKWE